VEVSAAQLAAVARTRFASAPLFAVAAPLALLAVALAVAAAGLTVQDSWLTLVSGREIAQHGLPFVDHLTSMASGQRWVDQQWLAQLLLYGAASVGGVGLAVAVCLLAVLTAFALPAVTAYRRGASPKALLVFVGWTAVTCPWGLQVRAQALALPLFSLILFLLARDPALEQRSTLLVLGVLVVWANVHGSVVVGVAVVGACGLYALVRGRRRGLALLAAPFTVLVSPYARDLPGYYRMMLLDPPFGRYIQEWQRTTPSPLTAIFFALAGAGLALVVARRRRLTALDCIVLAVTFVIAVDAIRGLIWFALAALAVLPALATQTPGRTRLEGRVAGRGFVAASGVIVLALGFAALRPAQAYETAFPEPLVELVQAHTADGGTVFASDATSDLLLWELPALRGRVVYDVRFETLTRPEIDRLLAWHRLDRGWEGAVSGASLVVDDRVHVARLVATGRWHRIFSSGDIAIAARTTERKHP
jgi:uncharacterized membrane protein YbaN (DUF454 family)